MKSCHFKILFLFLSGLVFLNVKAQTSNSNNPGNTIQKADSLFYAQNWNGALTMYEKLLGDTSHNSVAWYRLGFSNFNLGDYDKAMRYYKKALALNPAIPVKGSIYSGMARIMALRNEKQNAMIALDSAVNGGYANLSELDTLKAFNSIRNEPGFAEMRKKVYGIAFPCMLNSHAREFDFWVGEWNVLVTGSNKPAGHSLVQVIAGGCAILENWDSPASTGKSINFIDPNTNKWKQSWAGSYADGVQEFVNGEYKDSAMHFDFETKNAQGNKVIGRFIFYNQGPNQVRQLSETSGDGGKTWTTDYDFTYKRKN